MYIGQLLNINNVFFVVVIVFPNARCVASASKMKKGSDSLPEKPKQFKYSTVRTVVLVKPANPCYQLHRYRSLLTPTGFAVFQTVLFTDDFLCYQSEKATSNDEFS